MMNRYICNCLVGYGVGKKYDGTHVDSSSNVVVQDFMECESLEVYRRCCKEGHCS